MFDLREMRNKPFQTQLIVLLCHNTTDIWWSNVKMMMMMMMMVFVTVHFSF